MLQVGSRAEERVWHYVRDAGTLYASAEQVASATRADVEEARHVLDQLVSRNLLRRFDTPGESVVYWS